MLVRVISFFLLAPMAAIAQDLEFSEPEPIDIINSDAEELSPLVSQDGNTLYFVRGFHESNVGGRLGGVDIWSTKKDSLGSWQEPNNKVNNWNNRGNNAVIGIREDNKLVYLLNGYHKGSGVSFSKLLNGKWIKPELIPIKGIKSDSFVTYFLHPHFDVLLISMKDADSYGEEDLYVSLKDSNDQWGKPINLGPTVNTKGFEISPFLSFDKKRLYFASDGHKGYGGSDIYYTERKYGSWDVWTKPVNLGPVINSKNFEAYFSTFGDSIAYYSGTVEGRLSDIFRVPFNIKEDYVSFESLGNKELLTDVEIERIFGFNFKRVILFDKGSDQLDDIAKETLWFINDKLKNNKEVYLTIVGHTDSDGNNRDNYELSNDRVDATFEFLLDLGLEGWRISTSSQGENLASYTIDEQKKFDRKVEIYFHRNQ